MPDAAAEPALHIVVDHLRQAAELALDGLGLADEHFQHAILLALRQDEVVTAHLGLRLELAVDAAVALLDAAGVPRQVEVEEVGAVGLEVESLARRVGRQQDAERVVAGGRIEPPLDFLAANAAGEAVDYLDPFVGAVGPGDGLREDVSEVALRALAVLREDQHAALVPARRRTGRRPAERRQVRAHPLAHPVDQPPGLGVRRVARLLGDLLHPVEQPLLAPP